MLSKSLMLGGRLLPGGSSSSQRELGPRRTSFITSMQVRVETPPKLVSNSACPTCRAVMIPVDGSISAAAPDEFINLKVTSGAFRRTGEVTFL